MDKGTKEPVNPVIHDFYKDKCSSKKKPVAIGAVMHKICKIIYAMLRDNKPYEMITPEEHCHQYELKHPSTQKQVA